MEGTLEGPEAGGISHAPNVWPWRTSLGGLASQSKGDMLTGEGQRLQTAHLLGTPVTAEPVMLVHAGFSKPVPAVY